ncbi:single-stranded DNA-binding protein [Glutamicibacter arilaitensis]|uniref:Single-stranded DNA-binding protein n=1 Tax=Glutamicibacter arilaitensis TaxID=256701 RepID=A0A2N7RZK0_9MICC|nr:single-stranded DNA-binding protein [Glutamicibacter arilaitensis]PMQ19313.1 single-stranded DNA-binding protein [Glutamicibacter arilaitensis]
MANDTLITVVGNTTAPAELRFTASGSAVANFTVASTPRTFDRQTNEWKDGETLFLRCSVWREMAENVAETLSDKGMGIIVQGNLKQRAYEKDGEKRTVYELDVQEIGPSLRWASAKVTRTQRSGGGGNRAPQPQQSAQQSAPQQSQPQQGWNAPAADPWSTGNNPAPSNGGGWGNPQQTEPPF